MRIVYESPFLMQGRKKIAEVFGINPDTLKEWILDGAPVFKAGGKWQADYRSMVSWLEEVRPAKKDYA